MKKYYEPNITNRKNSSNYLTEVQLQNFKKLQFSEYIQTFITYDFGRTWQHIFIENSSGKCNNSDCVLHLSGVTTNKATIYSLENALGIVIGNGNIGKYLMPEGKTAVYISRDGGLNWLKVN